MPAVAKGGGIKPQKNQFDDAFLDLVGKEFKFDHAKGLAEWIKNSADAYSTTAKVKDAEQFILLRFKQTNPKKNSIFECIDFVGMSKADIDKALKIWGLPTAAKKGTDVATLGGHGNGGKFYMRQMFGTSRFITFRGGKLNIFGFDEKRRYGYEAGYEEVSMSLEEAMTFAGIDDLAIPAEVKRRWKRKPRQAGFTVVAGKRPFKFTGRATLTTILDHLRLHPQARRLLAHKQVICLRKGQEWGERLTPPVIEPREGFEKPRAFPLPRRFEFNGETFRFRTSKYPKGHLELRTSHQPLTRAGDLSALNAIDILGEVGCIGSYRMNELGFLRYAQEAEFIYGECECVLLEDDEFNCVRNDREKLVPNELSNALLEWIRQRVDELAGEMSEKIRQDQKSRDLRQSAFFNQILNRWKNQFMVKLQSDLFGGSGIGDTFGGAGAGGGVAVSGDGQQSKSSGDGQTGDQDGKGGGSGDTTKRGPGFPRVLLSGHDRDPLDEEATDAFHCDPRHPPVYQRDIDIEHGIYWINTSRPLADRLMDQFGSRSARWREYLFQRYVDIIVKQAVHQLGRTDPNLTSDKVDGLLDDVTSRVHDAAAQDLEEFLFHEHLSGSSPAAAAEEPTEE